MQTLTLNIQGLTEPSTPVVKSMNGRSPIIGWSISDGIIGGWIPHSCRGT